MKNTTGHARHRQQRGYSLPFVLLILIMLSISLASLLFVLLSGARSTESMLGRRRLFYACDGISRIAAVSAQDYFGQTATPTSEGLREFVCIAGGGCEDEEGLLPTFVSQTPGHAVKVFELRQGEDEDAGRRIAPLDSGPFEGMTAMQDNVDMKVAVQKSSSGWRCDVTQELSLAKIAMFQFFVFSDQPYTDWAPGPLMAGDGRVHANGDLCFYAITSGLFIDRVTASGRLSSGFAGETTCRSPILGDGPRGQAPRIAIVDNPTFDTNTGNGTPVEPLATHFLAFNARSSNTATWLAASAAFNGHLQDEAHRVVRLRLPVLGTPNVQRGNDASNGDIPNTTTRLLVDPVLASDAPDVRNQRFAFKADVRIINGVWYVRNPTAPNDLGTVVWSDHAGTYTTTNDQGVVDPGEATGQNQLFTASVTRPTRYSYYRFNSALQLTTTSLTPASVVSYGVLHRDDPAAAGAPSTAVWRPGVWCGATPAVTSVGAPCGSETFGERLLRGTRSGFRDGHAQLRFDGGNPPLTQVPKAEPNVLPMNIDIAALQNALADCTALELGSFFPGTCSGVPYVEGGPRRFNGIVYIANTWPGSMLALPSTPPGQGVRGGTGTVPQREQPALPQPLCTTITTATDIRAADSTDLNHDFVNCGSYEGGGITSLTSLRGARPTAVRLYNARNVNRSAAAGRPQLDRNDVLQNGPGAVGLTIASNLPIYVLGDVNNASIVGTEPPTVPAPHWVPFLVAGDVVSILSNAWVDDKASWNVVLKTSRDAKETTDHMEILAGWTPTTTTAYSGGVHNFPRFLEDWGGVPLHLKGSLVIGWGAVYARWKRACCDATSYQAPVRDWGFDKNLNNILNQPPGAPLYDVQATRRWKR